MSVYGFLGDRNLGWQYACCDVAMLGECACLIHHLGLPEAFDNGYGMENSHDLCPDLG